jgi:hypothetical protein
MNKMMKNHKHESVLTESISERIFEIEIVNKNGVRTKHNVNVDPNTTELFRIIELIKKSPNVNDVHIVDN